MFVAVVCFVLFYFTQSKYLYYGRSSTRIYLFWWMLKTFERFCFVFVFILQSKLPSSIGMNVWSILLSLGGGRHWSAVRVSSWNHPECILCSTQRRKPRGRRTVCLRSGSLPWWTNLSWWRWPTGTDRAAPGPSGTRSQRWTKLSSKQGRKCGWRPEETVLSYVSLDC